MPYEIRKKEGAGWVAVCPQDSRDPFRLTRRAEAKTLANQLFPQQMRLAHLGGPVTIKIVEVK